VGWGGVVGDGGEGGGGGVRRRGGLGLGLGSGGRSHERFGLRWVGGGRLSRGLGDTSRCAAERERTRRCRCWRRILAVIKIGNERLCGGDHDLRGPGGR